MGIKAKDKHGIAIEEEFFGKVWKWIGRDVRKHIPTHPHGIFIRVYGVDDNGETMPNLLEDFHVGYPDD